MIDIKSKDKRKLFQRLNIVGKGSFRFDATITDIPKEDKIQVSTASLQSLDELGIKYEVIPVEKRRAPWCHGFWTNGNPELPISIEHAFNEQEKIYLLNNLFTEPTTSARIEKTLEIVANVLKQYDIRKSANYMGVTDIVDVKPIPTPNNSYTSPLIGFGATSQFTGSFQQGTWYGGIPIKINDHREWFPKE